MRRFGTILLTALFALPLYAGISYQVKSETPGGAGDLVGTVRVEGSKFRMEMSEGDGMMFQDNSIVLSDDGGKTMMVLDPAKKEYYRLSLEETFNAMSSLMQSMGGMMEMSIDDSKVDVQSLGAGEAIEGYSTQKYKVDTSYTLNMKVMGMNMGQQVKTETTTWATSELDHGSSFVQMRSFRTGLEELDELIAKHSAAIKGFPLKAVTKSEMTARGKTTTSTTTMTVSNIKEETIPASEFAVPAGYREVDGPLAALQQMR